MKTKTLSQAAKTLGSKGGKTTHARHPEHLKTISKKGVMARKAKKKI